MLPEMADGPDRYFVRIDETLVGRPAGGSAADKAAELRHERPIHTRLARILGVHTDERAWRKGAHGERWMGWLLHRLPDGWIVFDDIPLGDRGANIDHLAIGPGGVFTINTKNLRGKIWVAPRTFLVNGVKQSYLPKASAEARRASTCLSKALGRQVGVRGILAVIADDIAVKEQPSDVYVAGPRGVTGWLKDLPAVLSAADVRAVAAVASKPETWR
jgi:nuclease-like protein